MSKSSMEYFMKDINEEFISDELFIELLLGIVLPAENLNISPHYSGTGEWDINYSIIQLISQGIKALYSGKSITLNVVKFILIQDSILMTDLLIIPAAYSLASIYSKVLSPFFYGASCQDERVPKNQTIFKLDEHRIM